MDNDKIDELLDQVNGVCISYNSYLYGIPNDDDNKQILRDIVTAWIGSGSDDYTTYVIGKR